jgi:hypothetical protein
LFPHKKNNYRFPRQIIVWKMRLGLLMAFFVILKVWKHSILELKGLGQEIWQEIDTEEYIQQERNSWAG